MFTSTRVGKRTKADEHNRSDASRVSSGSRTYGQFPSPYQHQGRPGTSSNPVLMHEPYQRRDQAEYYHQQVESYSRRSPSPVSPTSSSGHYYGDISSYSGPSRRSISFVSDHPSSPYDSPQYQPPPSTKMPANPQNYSNPRIISPSWTNQDPYYYSRPMHSGDPASSQPVLYHHDSIVPTGHSSDHTSPRTDHPGSYTPSYSLESALTPPQATGYRGISLTPLQIPVQHQTSARQSHTPSPDSAVLMEDQSKEVDQCGLASLNELKRPRYRREPWDEKTLQSFIGQSTP
jgi:hypothetical protein